MILWYLLVLLKGTRLKLNFIFSWKWETNENADRVSYNSALLPPDVSRGWLGIKRIDVCLVSFRFIFLRHATYPFRLTVWFHTGPGSGSHNKLKWVSVWCTPFPYSTSFSRLVFFLCFSCHRSSLIRAYVWSHIFTINGCLSQLSPDHQEVSFFF